MQRRAVERRRGGDGVVARREAGQELEQAYGRRATHSLAPSTRRGASSSKPPSGGEREGISCSSSAAPRPAATTCAAYSSLPAREERCLHPQRGSRVTSLARPGPPLPAPREEEEAPQPRRLGRVGCVRRQEAEQWLGRGRAQVCDPAQRLPDRAQDREDRVRAMAAGLGWLGLAAPARPCTGSAAAAAARPTRRRGRRGGGGRWRAGRGRAARRWRRRGRRLG